MSSCLKWTSASPEDTENAGRALASVLVPGDVVVLTGDLGAGKTRFTKGVAAGLGVEAPVTSPTFNILLVHEGEMPLYHFDLYRLDEPLQLEDIDYFATLESDGVSVVEWGDKFTEAEPLDGVLVTLSVTGDSERRAEARPYGTRGEAVLRRWCRALDVSLRPLLEEDAR